MRNTTNWRAAAVIAAAATIALAAGGSLDPSFGSGGVAWIQNPDGHNQTGMAVQADGKIVAGGSRATGVVNVLGEATTEWVIRHVDANGSLDAGFGTGGLVRLFGSSTGGADLPQDLDLDASGRVVVGGTSWVCTVTGKGKKSVVTRVAYATLVRLNANGSLDTTFGASGVVKIGVPGAMWTMGKTALLQPDGRILIVGATYFRVNDNTQRTQPFAARCLANGSLDTNFGTGGISVDERRADDRLGTWSQGNAALQSTGHIVFGVSRGPPDTWVVYRFLPNGAVDTGFNSPAASDQMMSIAVDRFDRIVATGQVLTPWGSSPPRAALVRRYLADGSADMSFGASGVATIDSYGQEHPYADPKFQPDDKIVFGATVQPTYPSSIYIATTIRLNDDGSLDSTYGTGGHGTLIDMGPDSPTQGSNVDIAPDGRIVLGGAGGPFDPGQWFFARYDAD